MRKHYRDDLQTISLLFILARLSKAKSTTHDFAQAIMKKLLNPIYYGGGGGRQIVPPPPLSDFLSVYFNRWSYEADFLWLFLKF